MKKFFKTCISTLTAASILAVSFVMPIHAEDNSTKIVTYDIPSNAPSDANINGADQYTVKVRPKGAEDSAWQDVAVYKTHLLLYQWMVAGYASFDCDGPVEVQVTVTNTTFFANLETASVNPASKGITPKVDKANRTITFTVYEPSQLIVMPNENAIHPLHLFVNPIENVSETSFGNKTVTTIQSDSELKSMYDTDVIYVEPGYYKQDFTLKSNQTMYIAGGAVINGCVNLDGIENAKLFGRGILESPKGRGLSIDCSENIYIEGITVNKYGAGDNGGCFVNIGNSKNVTLDNIKGMGHNRWSDGIDVFTSENVTIKDTFVRSTDDAIAVYGPRPNGGHLYWGETGDCKNLTVTGCVLAPDTAHPINIGTHGDYTSPNGGRSIDNLIFKDIDIVTYNTSSSGNPPLTSSIGISDGGILTNAYFDDIRIQDKVANHIFEIKIGGNAFSSGANNGKGAKNIYFKNISYTNESPDNLSTPISGYSDECMVKDVTFENLKINNKIITNADDGKFNIGSYVKNLKFVKSGESEYKYDLDIVPEDVWPDYYNYAVDKTISADGSESGHEESNIIDGDDNTSWRASDSETGHYVQIDLGETRTIDGGFRLTWEKENVFYRYSIQTSTDGENWETSIDKGDNKDTKRVQWDRHVNNVTQARYVRIVINSVSALEGDETVPGISEIEILGTENKSGDVKSAAAVKPSAETNKPTATEGTLGENITWMIADGILTLSGSGAITVDNSCQSPFADYDISSVVIGDGITEISPYLFSGCAMTSVTVPNSVKNIGKGAFADCVKLISLDLSNTSINVTPENLCYGCTSLESVTLPSALTAIGSGSFRDCTSLAEIEIPTSVAKIGSNSFAGCTAITEIEIPTAATEIGINALSQCSSLKAITLPEGIDSIGQAWFTYCTALTSIEIPEGVTSIGDTAFGYCGNLESVTLPSTLTVIEDNAFIETGLTSVDIPSSVKSIGAKAFADCSELETINFADDTVRLGASSIPGWTEIIVDGKQTGPRNITAEASVAAQVRGNNGWVTQRDGSNKFITSDYECIETSPINDKSEPTYFGAYYYFDINIPAGVTITNATLTINKCLQASGNGHSANHSVGFKGINFDVVALAAPGNVNDLNSIWSTVSAAMTNEPDKVTVKDADSSSNTSVLTGDVSSIISAGSTGIALLAINTSEKSNNRPLSGSATLAVTYTTEEVENPVAQIDFVTYSSLEAAIDAASSGDTIRLLQDITLDKNIIKSGKTLTIYGNDKTINNGSHVLEFTDNSNITLSNLTISGSGKLNIPGGSTLTADKLTVNSLQFGGYYTNLKGTVSNSTVKELTTYGYVKLRNANVTKVTIGGINNGSDQPRIDTGNGTSIGSVTLSGVNANAVLPYTLFTGENTPATITIVPDGYEYNNGVISKAEEKEPTPPPAWNERPELNSDITVPSKAPADSVNDTFQYHFAGGTDEFMDGTGETGKKYDAYLWVPQNVKPGELKGLVTVKMNLIEIPFVNSTLLRKSLAQKDFGILFLVFQRDSDTRYNTTFSNFNTREDYKGAALYNENDTIDGNNVFTSDGKDAADIMNDILKGIAKASGYGEIEDETPMITIGHSAASPFGYRSGNWNPDRIIAQMQLKNGMGAPVYNSTKGMVPKIPSLQYAAQYTEHAVGADRDRSVRDARWHITNQRRNTDMLVSHIIEWGSGHYDWSDNMTAMLIKYIEKAIEYRLPDDYGETGKLTDLTDGGYLMKPFEKDGSNERPVGYYQANSWLSSGQNNADASDADRQASFWFFDKEFADYVNGFTVYAIPESPDSKGTSVEGRTYSDTEPFMLMKDPSKSTHTGSASNVISPFTVFAWNPFSRYGDLRFVDYDKLANPSASADNAANLGGYDILAVDTYYMSKVPTVTLNDGRQAYDGSGDSVKYPTDTKAEFVPLMAPYEVVDSELIDMSGMTKDGTAAEAANVASVTRTRLRFHNNRVYFRSGCASTNELGTAQDSFGMIVAPEIRDESGKDISSFKAVSSGMTIPYVIKNTEQTLTLNAIDDVDIAGKTKNPTFDVEYTSSDTDLQKYTDVFVEYGPAKAVREVNDDGSYSWKIEVLLDEIPSGAEYPIEVNVVASNLGKWETVQGATAAQTFNIQNSAPETTTQEEAPDIAIDYANETLTGFETDGAYTINETPVNPADGVLAIEDYIGQTISIVKKGNNITTTDSEEQSLSIPVRPAAPTGIEAVDETAENANDGKITGVTEGMEYKPSASSEWIPVTGTEVTGLAPGAYEVRTKATGTSFASEAANVTVNAPAAPSIVIGAITQGDDTTTVNITVANPTSETANGVLIAAAYDSEGACVQVKLVTSENDDVVFNKLEAGYSIKAFLWNSLQDMTPLIATPGQKNI